MLEPSEWYSTLERVFEWNEEKKDEKQEKQEKIVVGMVIDR